MCVLMLILRFMLDQEQRSHLFSLPTFCELPLPLCTDSLTRAFSYAYNGGETGVRRRQSPARRRLKYTIMLP